MTLSTSTRTLGGALLAGALLASPALAADPQKFVDELDWFGDFRGRVEHFSYSDATPDRTRLRYRLRVGGKAKINDNVTAGFRLSSGHDDARSTNRTLGSDANASDPFDADPLNIDRAYIEFQTEALDDSKIVFGKMSNPFRWKNGKDYMLWDGDYNPEGVALQWKREGDIGLYANLGYMILNENSGGSDPHLFGIQFGADMTRGDITFGGRATFYSFNSLDSENPGALNSDGNIGLADGYFLKFAEMGSEGDSDIAVYELAAYAKCKTCIPNWPLLFYAHFAQAPTAADIEYTAEEFMDDDPANTEPPFADTEYQLFSGDDRNKAFGIGVEIGDKKKIARFGFGYYQLEADYFPGALIDSDLTDGKTNREGFTMYASKQIFKNTDFGVTLFSSDILEEGPGEIFPVTKADRTRVQVDLQVKF